MLPVAVLSMWFLSLLSLAVLGGGGYLLYAWYENLIIGAWPLVVGGLLLALSLLGRPLALAVLGRAPRQGEREPVIERGGQVHRLPRPDGTVLHIEQYGSGEGGTLVFTHGWGLNAAAWFYAKQLLAPRFRLILWDLPGLGESRAPDNRNYELPKLAADLAAVVEFAGGPVVLVGHSIGGMIMLTFAREFPELMRRQVRGLVLTHTTPENPVRTAWLGSFWRAVQEPLIKPMCFLTILLSPVMRLLSWLGYFNGLLHTQIHFGQYGGQETRGQLEFAARFTPLASPAVSARGMLAMTRYNAEDVLPRVNVPALVIAADHDKATLPAASLQLVRAIPGARIVTLSPAGHMGLFEQHTVWAEAVADFTVACFHDQPGLS